MIARKTKIILRLRDEGLSSLLYIIFNTIFASYANELVHQGKVCLYGAPRANELLSRFYLHLSKELTRRFFYHSYKNVVV